MTAPAHPTPRSAARRITAQRALEGEGFEVRVPFPTSQLDHLDPFLLLHHLGPVDFEPGEAKGAPDHPHRGFETVTYVLSGELEHQDSTGGARIHRDRGRAVDDSRRGCRAFRDAESTHAARRAGTSRASRSG